MVPWHTIRTIFDNQAVPQYIIRGGDGKWIKNGISAIHRFLEAIHDIPEVLECHHIAGDFDYLLKVRVKNIPAYQEFALQRLTSLDGIRTFETYFVLGTEKQETSLPLPENR